MITLEGLSPVHEKMVQHSWNKSTCKSEKQTDGDGGSGSLLTVHSLNVNNPLFTVDLNDFALTSLVGTTNDSDLIILANGDGTSLTKNDISDRSLI